MSAKKNVTLELLKLFASYMVVFVHALFSGQVGTIIDALARFAVPLFFVISGFFSYNISPEKIKTRIKHIARLIIFSTIIYTLFNVAKLVFEGNIQDVVPYFSKYFNFTTLIKFVIFNQPVSSGHLWYLFAALYVYGIFYFTTTLRIKEKVIWIIASCLLFLHILLGECLSAFGTQISYLILRNFALMGIPFFSLGLLAKKHEEKLRNISAPVIFFVMAMGTVGVIASRYLIGKNEVYFGSLLIVFAVTVVFTKYSEVQYPKFLNALTNCSTYIYIFHPMVLDSIDKLFPVFHIDLDSSVWLLNIRPIIVCVISTILAYSITRISNKHTLKKRT